MKKVLQFLISSLLVCIMLIGTLFFGIVLIPRNKFADSYMATLRTKYHVLKETNDPKIIIVGGSSSAFSMDNDLLEKETGYKVANTALHAGEGPLFETTIATANINKGDIVLVALEWGWHNEGAFDILGTDLIMQGIDNEIEMYKYIPFKKYNDILGYLFSYASLKKAYQGSNGVYSRSSFDEKGNMTIYRNSQVVGKWDELQTVTDVKNAVIAQDSIDYLKKYKKEVESKGASIYWITCPTWDETVQCDNEDFQKLKKQEEEKIGIKYISNPVDYFFPAKYMFDASGTYHCSTEGAIYRTELVVRDLVNAGVIQYKNPIIVEPGKKYNYEYTGDFQSFTALEDGKYQLEAWGSAGIDGEGSYSKGTIHLKKGDVLYTYVGGEDGWNWNGIGNTHGGDATDFRLKEGSPLEFDSLKSRIMVAAGGSGSGYYDGGINSSYISGYIGCNAIDAKSTKDNIKYTGQPIHYSGNKFENMEMYNGESNMPAFESDSAVIGNGGLGHARITFIGK